MFSQRGFSLLDLAIATLVIGLVLAGAGAMISKAFLDMEVNQTLADMEEVNRNMRAIYPHEEVMAAWPSFHPASDFDTSILPETMSPYAKRAQISYSMGELSYQYFYASHPWSANGVAGDTVIEVAPGYPYAPPAIYTFNALVFRYSNVPPEACFALVLRAAPDAWRVRFEVGGAWIHIVTPTARQVDSSLVRSACANYTRFNIEFIKVKDDVY